jgi:hypothetical protein
MEQENLRRIRIDRLHMLYEENNNQPVWIVLFEKEIPDAKNKVMAAMAMAKHRETVIEIAKASVTEPGYRLVFCEPIYNLFYMANFGFRLDD